MNTWDTILREISNAVQQEAATAPQLFADFARIERYIAESYHERALIELIQNADDASARRAVLVVEPGYALFGNNGRAFDESDLRAICRSGTSVKRAERNTIGYRGIGFKSTINFAGRIHIISDSLAFTFSNDLTKCALKLDQVPAVRMPHPLSIGPDVHNSVSREIDGLKRAGYTTFFIFESREAQQAAIEFAALDGDALIFLRNLEEMELRSARLCRRITVGRQSSHPFVTAEIIDGAQSFCWLIYSHPSDSATALAFPLDRDGRIDGDCVRSFPVHCFLPTQEATGYPFRINADFSTDPSRTRITFDDRSASALHRLGECVVSLLSRIAAFDVVPEQFGNLFLALSKPVGFARAGEKLRQAINAAAGALEWLPGNAEERGRVRVRPSWLNSVDYSRLMHENSAAIHTVSRLDASCPGLMPFLTELGVQPLSGEAVRQRCADLSELGLADTIFDLVEQLRVTGNDKLRAHALSLPLWPDDSGCRRAAAQARSISPKFKQVLMGRLSAAQLQKCESIWGVGLELHGSNAAGASTGSTPASPPIESRASPACVRPVIRRWRRCEENLRNVLAGRLDVAVNDVSRSNLGYDLEVVYRDGRKDYVEVKELSREGGEFALTSNEYATASALGSQYVIAVCAQDETGFAWTLIRDPIATVPLVKRCRQWEWVCPHIPRLTDREDF